MMKLKILFMILMFLSLGAAASNAGSILSLDFTSNGSGDAQSYGGAVAGTGNYLEDGFTAFVVEELGPSANVSTDPAITVNGITFAITGSVSAWPGDNVDIVEGTIDPLRGDYLFLPEVDGVLGADNQLIWTVSGLAADAAYPFTFIHGDNGTRTVTINSQGYELLIDGNNWTGTLTLVTDDSGVITGTATGGSGEGNWAGFVIEVDTQAHDPGPADGAIKVDTNAMLTWQTGLDPANPNQINPAINKHFVWMSSGSYTDPNLVLVETITGTISENATYNPGGLPRDSKFWWRIDEGIGDYPAGDPNNIIGDIWVFETVPSSPEIEQQPQDALVFAGEDAVFTVEAINPFTLSSEDVSYQWYKMPDTMLTDGSDYLGTTTSTFTVTAAELSDEGQYFCRLTNTAVNTLSVDTDAANLIIKRVVGHWPFDGNLDDIVGGNDGTYTGTKKEKYDDGIIDGGEAIDFQPIDNPVTIPSAAQTGLAWTFSWWDNGNPDYSSTEIWETMIGCGAGSTGWEVFEFSRESGEWYAFGFDYGINYWWSPVTYPRGQWHFQVVSYDPATLTADWYVDGVKIRQFSGVNTTFDVVFYIGNVRGLSQPYIGMIDDLKLYNYPVKVMEVADMYLEVVGPFCAVKPAFDLNDDCEVTIDDILLFVIDWMQCGRYPQCVTAIP